MKKIILHAMLIGIVFAFSQRIVDAESSSLSVKCAIMKFDKEYERSKAVFIGKVVTIEKKGNSKVFTFKVKKYWKGISEKAVKVSVSERARYQAQFKVDREYLVFAKVGVDGELRDFRCSRSRDLKGFGGAVKEDLKKLGKGKTCIDLEK